MLVETRLSQLTKEDCLILHAAMLSMVHENHSCQDNLSDAQWRRAEQLYKELEHYLAS